MGLKAFSDAASPLLRDYRMLVDSQPDSLRHACSRKFIFQVSDYVASLGCEPPVLEHLLSDKATISGLIVAARDPGGSLAAEQESSSRALELYDLDQAEPPWNIVDEYSRFVSEVQTAVGAAVGLQAPSDFPARWQIGASPTRSLALEHHPPLARVNESYRSLRPHVQLVFETRAREGARSWDLNSTWGIGDDPWSPILRPIGQWEKQGSEEPIGADEMAGHVAVFAELARFLRLPSGRDQWQDLWDATSSTMSGLFLLADQFGLVELG